MKRLIILSVTMALLLVAQLLWAGGDRGCTSTGLLSDNAAIVTSGGYALCSVLVITDGTNAATAIVYDNAVGAGGTVLFKGVVPGSASFGGGDAGSPISITNGIYFTISGTGANAIVYYR